MASHGVKRGHFDRDPSYSGGIDNHTERSESFGSDDSSSDSPTSPRREVKTPKLIRSSVESPPPHQKTAHYCYMCDKQFSSGKAFGGHVRIHSSQQRRNALAVARLRMISNRGMARTSQGNVKCSLCHKEFKSKRSLFGHMRRHPNRGWRGIKPPENSSVSSEDEEYEEDEDEDKGKGLSNQNSCTGVLERNRYQEEERKNQLKDFKGVDQDSTEVARAACILMTLSRARKGSAPKISARSENDYAKAVIGKRKAVVYCDTTCFCPIYPSTNKRLMSNECSVAKENSGILSSPDFDLNEPYLDPNGEDCGFK